MSSSEQKRDRYFRSISRLREYYYFNLDELVCSDLDAGDRLMIDPAYPYRNPRPTSEEN